MTTAFDQTLWFAQRQQEITLFLEKLFPPGSQPLPSAMRYAMLNGGKRWRPLLCLATQEMVEAKEVEQWSALRQKASLKVALSIECIHTYSLIHDDMPCMDNDVLRRGQPTVHVQFGEAMALLAGDALQSYAFELLTHQDVLDESAGAALGLVQALAEGSGPQGMCQGQAIDLAHVGLAMNLQEIEKMHRLKTGALLQATMAMGGLMGGATKEQIKVLKDLGQQLGLLFQVMDDILDATASSETLGKTAGKDAHDQKPTYVSLMGVDASYQYAQTILAQWRETLESSSWRHHARLKQMAQWVIQRKY